MPDNATEQGDPDEEVATATEGDAPSLVGLRLLMEEGVRRSSDRSPVGRRVAIVILDGAVEAAIGVCLSNFGEDFGEKLDDGYSKLIAALKADGRLQGNLSCAQDVKRLRKARNLTQHHGITPDASEMQGWAKAVQSFVEHAIRATYNIDLSLITFADALATKDLRTGFREAETLLANGDVRGCVRELDYVFGKARRRSDAQHRASRVLSPLVPDFGQNSDPTTAYVEDLLSVATFATDLGEYLWWRSIAEAVRLAPRTAEVTEQEAQRAISFIFNWILRWEGFTATYITDRLGRWPEQTPPPSPHSDGRPVLMPGRIEVRAQTLNVGGQPDRTRFVAKVPFAAASDDIPWTTWRHFLNTAFNSYREHQGTSVPWNMIQAQDDGFIGLEVTKASEMGAIKTALNDVFELAARLRVEAEAATMVRRTTSEAAAPLVTALKGYRAPDGSPVFSKVELRQYAQAEGPAKLMIEASFAPDFHALALRRHGRMGWDVSEIVGPGTFHPIGIHFESDAAIDHAIAFADSCIELLTGYRQLEGQESAAVEAARQELESRLNESSARPTGNA